MLERSVFNNRKRGDAGLRRRHRAAGDRRGDPAHSQRELREDDPAQPPVHPELPGEPRRAARPGQRAAHRRREPERRHLRSEVREHAQEDPRRGLPHPRRRPGLGEVALGAGRALDRGHRGGLPRRPGDARQLRRQRRRDREAARQHRPRRHRRQPGRQRLQVDDAGRAAARHRSDHRPAHRLPRASRTRSRRSAAASRPTAARACT